MCGERGKKKTLRVLLYRSVAAVDVCNDPYGVSFVQGDSENKVFSQELGVREACSCKVVP